MLGSGVVFHDISKCMDKANAELGNGYTKVPRVFKDGKFVGGATELETLLKSSQQSE